MLIGRFLLIAILLLTFILIANTTTNNQQLRSSTISNEKSTSFIFSAPPSSTAVNRNECQEPCSLDYCLKYTSINKDCTRLIRDQCDCCTVCLRTENQVCGGHLNVYGLCEQGLLCYKTTNVSTNNLPEHVGICVKACLKFQCLLVNINNITTCECANRRVPCNENFHSNTNNNNSSTGDECEQQLTLQQQRELSLLKTNDAENKIDCSNVICDNKMANNSTACPDDSHFIETDTPLEGVSSSLSKNLSSLCCKRRGHCVCSKCPKTICGENSVLQIYRVGNDNVPGQCCDQFKCFEISQQCHHDRKIYNENEVWSIDPCTTCTCRDGLVGCTSVQCPTYEHCGYMYKSENECCPKCGGCLDDRSHVRHMNSTWYESNGCMKCWCDNGRSRCITESCIAPPCENPRQLENVCCPVCDDIEDYGDGIQDYHQRSAVPQLTQSISTTDQCPSLDKCLLTCENGLVRNENGCLQCTCSTMSCPSPLCTLKIDRFSKQYCSCMSPKDLNCEPLNCDKHCPYNYLIDKQTGCSVCQCNPCPTLVCTKNCTFGLKNNAAGCPICICERNLTQDNNTKSKEVKMQTWSRQCHSGSLSYSNGEIWFDGCRQCLCHKGEQLCALISCPTLKCSQPIRLPNRCCPSCPEIPMLPEQIPSSQVCYAGQYVSGEELEFDSCTRCMCLHNIAFCSVSLCPPLRCSTPIYDSSLCCLICPPQKMESLPTTYIENMEDDICTLENGVIKRAGELWKQDDCQSCLCPRGNNGKIECFTQKCDQNLPCSNPVLKKGQCCPFCLPPTASMAVCIFNHVQYRSGEHWNVSECHHCECSYGTIICHQEKCPSLTCVHTVTLSGHCCPICRDQLSSIYYQSSLSQSRFRVTIIAVFSIIVLMLIFIIFILACMLLHGRRRSLLPSNQSNTTPHHSPTNVRHSSLINSKPIGVFSYVKYDLMSASHDSPNNNNNHHANMTQNLSLSKNIPSASVEQASIHSVIDTNTTATTGTNSSNNELEPATWTEDEPMLPCSASSSNDGDEEHEHETVSSDNDESHQQQLSHPQVPMIAVPSTIIYV